MYVEHRLADEVVEADAGERELGAQVAARRLGVHALRPLVVDRVHAVDVRPGAEAAAARLDAEQVAEHRDDEVRVQQPAARGAGRARRSPAARRPVLPRISMFGFAPHDASARRAKSCSRRRISSRADRLLEREHEPGADRLDDRRRAALLADRRLGVVGVPRRADEQDRAAARHRRDPVAEQRALGDEHARRPGAADELVRREEHGVLVGECRRGSGAGSCRSAGTGRPPRSPSTPARRGGAAAIETASTSVTIPVTFEAAEKLPIFSGRSAWRRAPARGASRSTPPVASSRIVTTSATDSRQGSSFEWCSYGPTNTTGRSLEVELEQPDELVDRAGRARAAEHHDVVVAAVDRPVDDARARPRAAPSSAGRSPTPRCACCAYSGRTGRG